jgi:putative component of membrane protein insertase Oxa1/YidC/SpoIIIJ protein YidD
MRKNVIKLINFYQKTLSPDTGFLKKIGLINKPICVFYPSCSEYTKEAVLKYGSVKGIRMGFFRIFRCHPWQKEHIDLLK